MASFIIGGAFATDYPSIASPYGQIQNVQNYSSNPFWSPNGGYNQAMPTAVYVTGPDVSTGDCINIVDVLISSYCAQFSGCAEMQLTDIRPAIVLQLSRLEGHNYATNCIGYIDTSFDKYIKNNQKSGVVYNTSFPTGPVVPNPNVTDKTFQIQLPKPAAPQWQVKMEERKQELKRLQQD